MAEIYETMITTSRKDLKAVEEELDRHTPQALHSMLQNKQNKEEAIGKYHSRKQKERIICPPNLFWLVRTALIGPIYFINGARWKTENLNCWMTESIKQSMLLITEFVKQ